MFCLPPEELQQAEKSPAQSLDVPAESPKSGFVFAEVRGENAESKGAAPPPSEVEGSSKAQRRQKEVTLKSREPTRVQTFAPEVQEEVATADVPLEPTVELAKEEAADTPLIGVAPQELTAPKKAPEKR